jgi:hypothetical protein
MPVLGHVKEIWRFPVKSMQGSTVPESLVTPRGLTGRGWAMRDDTRQVVQWGKLYPQLMLCVARYRQDPAPGISTPVDITFPDGSVLGSDDPAVQRKLSELCRRRQFPRARQARSREMGRTNRHGFRTRTG